MESQHQSLAARFANVAFHQAVESLRGEPPSHPHIIAVQATFWACCLDEMLSHLSGYKSARNGDPDGRVLHGLRMARNAATHGAVVCANYSGGLTWPIQYPIKWYSDIVWAPTDTVQRALTRPPNDAMVDSYQDSIGGRTVVQPLDAVRSWFSRSEQQGFILPR